MEGNAIANLLFVVIEYSVVTVQIQAVLKDDFFARLNESTQKVKPYIAKLNFGKTASQKQNLRTGSANPSQAST